MKIGEYLPEYKGKIEFYLSVLNDTIKFPNENEEIGIIICKSKDRTIVEYSLKSSNLPIGVATYKTFIVLPKEYKDLLPSKMEIANKINQYFNMADSNNLTIIFRIQKLSFKSLAIKLMIL